MPSHYMNQCWFYVQLESWQQLSVKFEPELYHYLSRTCICVCQMAVILSRGNELKRFIGTHFKMFKIRWKKLYSWTCIISDSTPNAITFGRVVVIIESTCLCEIEFNMVKGVYSINIDNTRAVAHSTTALWTHDSNCMTWFVLAYV